MYRVLTKLHSTNLPASDVNSLVKQTDSLKECLTVSIYMYSPRIGALNFCLSFLLLFLEIQVIYMGNISTPVQLITRILSVFHWNLYAFSYVCVCVCVWARNGWTLSSSLSSGIYKTAENMGVLIFPW